VSAKLDIRKLVEAAKQMGDGPIDDKSKLVTTDGVRWYLGVEIEPGYVVVLTDREEEL